MSHVTSGRSADEGFGELRDVCCGLFMCQLINISHFTVQGEPGAPGVVGLPGSPGRGLPGQKVTHRLVSIFLTDWC